ncbi:hypothetical protein ACIBEJ_50695 [Nonomuraea sp. NPDC050790]|uniref:hypothetical protein n=1 Tax=Nonomuraea sp. NPDC050790 TaxID=3364371 RepID=UPI00378C505A
MRGRNGTDRDAPALLAVGPFHDHRPAPGAAGFSSSPGHVAGASKKQVLAALESVEELVPEDDGAAEAALRAALVDKFNTVRPFLKLLGQSKSLGAAAGGRPMGTPGCRWKARRAR